MTKHPAQARQDFTRTALFNSNLSESNTMMNSVYTNQLQSAGDQHEILVRNMFKDMGTLQQNLMHAAAGIAGESGELLDAVKKHWAYNKPLDMANIIEELGDIEFYMRALRNLLDISREDVLLHNISKLSKRYSNGTYSDKQAQDRADKVNSDATLDFDKANESKEFVETLNEMQAILNGDRL